MRPLLFLICGPVLFGQLELNTITVTATRTINVQPDQAVFSVSVLSPLDATLDQVVAAVQGSGITASQFSGFSASAVGRVPSSPFFQVPLQWNFVVAVPLGRLSYEIASLTALQQSLTAGRSQFSVYFSVSGIQASPELLAAQQCSNADLIADARAHAQKLASAAQLWLGEVSSVSEPVNATAAFIFNQIITVRSGSFAGFLLGTSPISIPPAPTTVTCSLEVKFSATQ